MPPPDQNLRRLLWKAMEAVKRLLGFTVNTFHNAYTRPMPRWSPPPLGIKTTSLHVDSSARHPSWKAACTSTTTFYQ